jgi:hypothetical protein
LAVFAVGVFLWVRQKALQAEQERLADFIRAEALVKTEFVVKD